MDPTASRDLESPEPDVEQLMAGLMADLDRVEGYLDALDETDLRDGDGLHDGVSGPGVGAQENRTIHAARAHLARIHAAGLRERVARARTRAQQIHERAERILQRTPRVPELGPLTDTVRTSIGAVRAEDGVERVLRGVAAAALRSIPAADHVGVLALRQDGTIVARASTDALADQVDQLEVETGEGPSREAVRTGELVHVEDLRRQHARWPAFVPPALDLGLRGVVALPLLTRPDRPDLVLTLHAGRVDGLGAADVAVGRLFALLAERTLDGAFAVDGLHVALKRRDVIGQAKGMLMLRHGISADQAFTRLRQASQATNRKLVDVARRLVADAVTGAGRSGPR